MTATVATALESLRGLEKALDRLIGHANADEWDELEQDIAASLTLFDTIQSIDFVPSPGSPSAATDELREKMQAVLGKINALGELVLPKHRQLGEILANFGNARKLSKAYGE